VSNARIIWSCGGRAAAGAHTRTTRAGAHRVAVSWSQGTPAATAR
jgi:hypothetical protein